ncbi:MAG TPA: NAD(P)/FAD-dependent oxidoreductase [Miltoncostaeaceae bacterium]|nr:NAD(P)/FAD-dependent oxidoreductase [Miltoncostaeaceae bacterium]
MTASSPSDGPRPRFDVIVLGAGQAGLAMGYFLARRGLRFLILERASAVGPAWRERWDSLVLFTPARFSGLPGLPFPGDPDHHPTRDEVVAYLERYAERFRLPIAFDRRVDSVAARDGRYVVRAGDVEYEADQVVVATGPFQVPRLPDFAERLSPDVVQMHSTGYRRPGDLPAGRALVVGGGNTGVQIAHELTSTHDVHLALGSRQMPLPQRLLGRDLFWWLTKLRLMAATVDSRVGRRMRSRDTLVGSSPRRLRRRHAVKIHPRAIDAAGSSIAFADGTTLELDVVIWATGYRLDQAWLRVPKGPDGTIAHRRGITDAPGLYLLGLTWQHTRGSALLGWVAEDAEFIAEEIAVWRAAAGGTRRSAAAE